MRRIRLLAGWAALAVAASACDRPRGGAAAGEAAGGLEGRWTLELRLELPVQLRTDTSAVAPVRGEVTLLENRRLRRAGHLGGPPTHSGSHTLDLRPFAIDLRAGGRVPTAAARLVGPDSLELALDPEGSGGGLTLAGRIAADSAAGRWWWYGPGRRRVSAAGRFVLRRE